jgi:5-methylcytosine-specific restriction enzyme subunit McrC
MLAYAFQVLNENGYKNIETEQFDNVGELCAVILAKGVALQLKRGGHYENMETLGRLQPICELHIRTGFFA